MTDPKPEAPSGEQWDEVKRWVRLAQLIIDSKMELWLEPAWSEKRWEKEFTPLVTGFALYGWCCERAAVELAKPLDKENNRLSKLLHWQAQCRINQGLPLSPILANWAARYLLSRDTPAISPAQQPDIARIDMYCIVSQTQLCGISERKAITRLEAIYSEKNQTFANGTIRRRYQRHKKKYPDETYFWHTYFLLQRVSVVL